MLHGDHGVGSADEQVLLLTWGVGWTTACEETRAQVNTWSLRFPFAVLPMSRCTPATFQHVLGLFVDRTSLFLLLDVLCMLFILN